MHRDWVDDISRGILAAAAVAGLPGEPAAAWDSSAWRWTWTAECDWLRAELSIEVAPDLSRSQAPSSLQSSDFRLVASGWDAGREAVGWSRTYFVGRWGMIWPSLQGPVTQDSALVLLLRQAWDDLNERLEARDREHEVLPAPLRHRRGRLE